jgi:hypothetical protein
MRLRITLDKIDGDTETISAGAAAVGPLRQLDSLSGFPAKKIWPGLLKATGDLSRGMMRPAPLDHAPDTLNSVFKPCEIDPTFEYSACPLCFNACFIQVE